MNQNIVLLLFGLQGAHFLSSDNFRPGVAKLFLTHAGEERMHAKALIDYLTMRGVDDEGYASVEPISFVRQLPFFLWLYSQGC